MDHRCRKVDLLRMNYDILERNADDRNPLGVYQSGVRTLSNFMSGFNSVKENRLDLPDSYIRRTKEVFQQWVKMYKTTFTTHGMLSASALNRQFNVFVSQMNMTGMFKTDVYIIRFFRLCIEMCLDLSNDSGCGQEYSSHDTEGPFADLPVLNQSLSARSVLMMNCDAFSLFVTMLIRNAGDSRTNQVRMSLLAKVFGLVAAMCIVDHETATQFKALMYQRIIFSLLKDFTTISLIPNVDSPNTQSDQVNFTILHAFMNALYYLNPSRTPKFTCQWLELVGNGSVLGIVFNSSQQKTPARVLHSYAILLTVLIRFLERTLVVRPDTPKMSTLVRLTNSEERSFTKELFTAALRLFLVILHDFPEFTCDYCYELIDAIPIQFIQLRNMVLSAYFRQMPPPDPCADPIKLDLIVQPFEPSSFAYMHDIQPESLKCDIETFFSRPDQRNEILGRIKQNLRFHPDPNDQERCSEQPYNLRLLSAMVQHAGVTFLKDIETSKTITPETASQSPQAGLLVRLSETLDDEGTYILLTVIANQLRYPNGPTQFFSSLMLHIYQHGQTSQQPLLSEIVTRVLTERLLVSRPHPWGLMLTFIELIRNSNYQLWQNNFIRWLPEIESIFLNLNRSASRMPGNISTSSGQTTGTSTAATAGMPSATTNQTQKQQQQ
ncbi:hypothetical protein ACOME3_000443 [Neoechinorhynchus agilis]